MSIVSGIVCNQEDFFIGGSSGRDEAEEVGLEGAKGCGVDDGFGDSDGVRV